MSERHRDDDDDDDDDKPARWPPVPQPVLVPELIGSFTIGTPVKYSGTFWTVCRVIAGTDKLDLIGFDANDIPIFANAVSLSVVQRYKRI